MKRKECSNCRWATRRGKYIPVSDFDNKQFVCEFKAKMPQWAIDNYQEVDGDYGYECNCWKSKECK